MDFLKAFESLILSIGAIVFLVATISPISTKWVTIVLTRTQRFTLMILAIFFIAGAIIIHADSMPNSSIPVGSIIAWDPTTRGDDGTRLTTMRPYPKGWRLCDGTNKTPDLNARFLVGTNASALAGIFQGSNSLANDGAHNHTGETAAHAGYTPGQVNFNVITGHNDTFMPKYTIPAESPHNHGGDNRPANYSVIFLCKTE